MKKRLLITLLIAGMLISCMPAFAETDISFSQTGDKLILSGTTDAGNGTYAVVDIFPAGKYVDSDGKFDISLAYDALAKSTDKNSVLVYTNQTEVKKGGYNFTVRFVRYSGLEELSTVSGMYTAVVRSGDDTVYSDILYVLPSEREAAIKGLTDLKEELDADRKTKVCSFIRTNKFALGIYNKVFDALTVSELNDMMYTKTEEYGYSFGDGEDYIKDLKKVVAVQSLNDKKVSDIDELKDELELTNDVFKKWYTGDIVDGSFRSILTSRLSGKGIKTTDAFEEELKEALILTYNEKSDGIDDIKSIFEAFKGDFDVTKSFSDEAYRSVTGESYSSFGSFVDALDSYREETGGTSGGKNDKNTGGGIKVYTPAASSAPVVTPVPQVPSAFADVANGHWAQTAIYALKNKGIIAGKTQSAFCPDDNITREEFVKLVTAMSGVELADGELPFADADTSAWYAKYLASAYKFGIIKGSNDGSFGVGRFITRQDIAVMLVRALELKGTQLSDNIQKAEFTDADAVSQYALNAVNKLKSAGVLSGYTDGSVKPLGLASRAEAAQMIYKAMLLIK